MNRSFTREENRVALAKAIASNAVEGIIVDADVAQMCEKLLNNEISWPEYLNYAKSKYMRTD